MCETKTGIGTKKSWSRTSLVSSVGVKSYHKAYAHTRPFIILLAAMEKLSVI
jgi:hypothetical protein